MGSAMNVNTSDAAIKLMQSVARMAMHAGKGVDKGAGTGYVGMLGGMPIKLATHHDERTRAEKTALKENCAELRGAMKSAVDTLLKSAGKNADDKAVRDIYKNLGLDPQGKELKSAPLLTRSKALAVIKDLSKIVGAPLAGKLESLEGEKTIKESSAKKLGAALNDALEMRTKFMTETLKPILEDRLPGPENETKRYNLAMEISTRIIVRNGELGVLGTGISLGTELNASDKRIVGGAKFGQTVNRLLGSGRGNDFAEAVAVLFHKTAVAPDANWDVAQLQKPVPVAKGDVVRELRLPPAGAERSFAIFKNIATVLPPVTSEKDGRKSVSYSSFHTWLAHASAEAAGKSVEALTLGDVRAFVKENWNARPKTLGAQWVAKPNVSYGFEFPISHFFKVAQESLASDMAFSTAEELAAASDESFAAALAQSGANKFEVVYTSVNDLYYGGGGLVAVNEEKFSVGADEVTSRVTPKRKYEHPAPKSVVSNLALTELEKNGQTVFKALRFGSVNLHDGSSDEKQMAHYGQLVEQTLLANPELLAQAKETGKIDLPLCRVDMAGKADMDKCARKYSLEIDGKTIEVTPKETHFRLATDSAVSVSLLNGTKTEYRALSKKDVEQNDKALATLLESAKTSADPQVKELAKQLKDYWSDVKSRHCDKDGNLQLFAGYGAEMMKFGARITVLSQKLGNVPSFNCDGGRDRTGLMDVECKTLALWLADGKTPPPITGKADLMNELRAQVRRDSGNQQIARQIKLNDDDMYLNQVRSLGSDLPKEIRSNDGGSMVPWKDRFERTSGLDALYVVKAPPSAPAQKMIAANHATAVSQLVKWCNATLAATRADIADGKQVDFNTGRLKHLIGAFGETEATQKAWAEKYLRNHPEIDQYCDTYPGDEAVKRFDEMYAEQLKTALSQAMRFEAHVDTNGFASTFIREMVDSKVDSVTINGQPPRSERQHADIDPCHGSDNAILGKPRSERCKAFLEQLAEVIPDPGMRCFVTAAITPNGFEMMLGAKLMEGAAINDLYTGAANTLKDKILAGGNNVDNTQISLTVGEDGSIDIRLLGGPGVCLMGAELVPGAGTSEVQLFDMKFESRIHIPGGQKVAVGEAPQFTCSIQRPE